MDVIDIQQAIEDVSSMKKKLKGHISKFKDLLDALAMSTDEAEANISNVCQKLRKNLHGCEMDEKTHIRDLAQKKEKILSKEVSYLRTYLAQLEVAERDLDIGRGSSQDQSTLDELRRLLKRDIHIIENVDNIGSLQFRIVCNPDKLITPSVLGYVKYTELDVESVFIKYTTVNGVMRCRMGMESHVQITSQQNITGLRNWLDVSIEDPYDSVKKLALLEDCMCLFTTSIPGLHKLYVKIYDSDIQQSPLYILSEDFNDEKYRNYLSECLDNRPAPTRAHSESATLSPESFGLPAPSPTPTAPTEALPPTLIPPPFDYSTVRSSSDISAQATPTKDVGAALPTPPIQDAECGTPDVPLQKHWGSGPTTPTLNSSSLQLKGNLLDSISVTEDRPLPVSVESEVQMPSRLQRTLKDDRKQETASMLNLCGSKSVLSTPEAEAVCSQISENNAEPVIKIVYQQQPIPPQKSYSDDAQDIHIKYEQMKKVQREKKEKLQREETARTLKAAQTLQLTSLPSPVHTDRQTLFPQPAHTEQQTFPTLAQKETDNLLVNVMLQEGGKTCRTTKWKTVKQDTRYQSQDNTEPLDLQLPSQQLANNATDTSFMDAGWFDSVAVGAAENKQTSGMLTDADSRQAAGTPVLSENSDYRSLVQQPRYTEQKQQQQDEIVTATDPDFTDDCDDKPPVAAKSGSFMRDHIKQEPADTTVNAHQESSAKWTPTVHSRSVTPSVPIPIPLAENTRSRDRENVTMKVEPSEQPLPDNQTDEWEDISTDDAVKAPTQQLQQGYMSPLGYAESYAYKTRTSPVGSFGSNLTSSSTPALQDCSISSSMSTNQKQNWDTRSAISSASSPGGQKSKHAKQRQSRELYCPPRVRRGLSETTLASTVAPTRWDPCTENNANADAGHIQPVDAIPESAATLFKRGDPDAEKQVTIVAGGFGPLANTSDSIQITKDKSQDMAAETNRGISPVSHQWTSLSNVLSPQSTDKSCSNTAQSAREFNILDERYLDSSNQLYAKLESRMGIDLREPTGITVHNDLILVCDKGNNLLKVYNQKGQKKMVFASSPSFDEPTAVLTDEDGKIYVKDKRLIHVLTMTGECSEQLGRNELQEPYGLCWAPYNELLILDHMQQKLMFFNKSGTLVRSPTFDPLTRGSTKAKCRFVECILVNDPVVIIVSDLGQNCVYVVDLDGVLLLELQSPDGFSYVAGITSDTHGNILIANNGTPHKHVQVFDSTGQFVCKINTPEQLDVMSDILVTPQATLIVVNYLKCDLAVYKIVEQN